VIHSAQRYNNMNEYEYKYIFLLKTLRQLVRSLAWGGDTVGLNTFAVCAARIRELARHRPVLALGTRLRLKPNTAAHQSTVYNNTLCYYNSVLYTITYIANNVATMHYVQLYIHTDTHTVERVLKHGELPNVIRTICACGYSGGIYKMKINIDPARKHNPATTGLLLGARL